MNLEALDNTSLINYIKELQNNFETKLQEYERKYDELKGRYDLLIYKRFARSAEKLLADDRQQSLFAENPAETEEERQAPEENEQQPVKSYTRKKPGRKPIDPNLPRKEEIIDIPEEEKICACGAQMTRIGEETSEKVEIIPPSMYVLKTVRPKYACRCCEGTEDEDKPAVRIAPVPPAIIPRSIAGASLVSYVMIQKYQDHLPYYRQEVQFRRIGIEISRQDMSNWQQQVYSRLLPLFSLMKETVQSGPVIQMDETVVQVMGEEGREDTQKSYMWLARGGPPGKRWWYTHTARPGGLCTRESFLKGTRGICKRTGTKAMTRR